MTIPPWLENLLKNEIHDRIANDPRTTLNTFLGYPRDRIFSDVINGGQADFDSPIDQLSGDDRALLYAKYNQRGHIDELIHAFSLLFPQAPNYSRLTIIDIGCGPFTAGLAFAAVIGPHQTFRYYGIDTAQSMLRLGESLAGATAKENAFDKLTTVQFGKNFNDFDFGRITGEPIVIIASYLLASNSFNISHFIKELTSTLSKIGQGMIAFLYTNSASSAFAHRYEELRFELENSGFKVETEETERFIKTKNSRDIHYALFYKRTDLTYKGKIT